MNPKVIKIDLEHIKVQTGAMTTFDSSAISTALDQIYGTLGGLPAPTSASENRNDFCKWATENKAKLNAPFDTLNCAEKNSVSLYDFAKHGMYKGVDNMTVWDVYARGVDGSGGQLFKDGTVFEYTGKSLTDHFKNNEHSVYTISPDVCSHKYLKWVRELQMALSIIILLYLLLHAVHMFVASNPTTTAAVKMGNELALIGMSVIVYVFVIIVFFIDRRSPIFTKCAWITQWFQDDMFMLYGITWTYLILGILGLALVVVHLLVMYSGKGKAEANSGITAAIYNLVPDPQTSVFP